MAAKTSRCPQCGAFNPIPPSGLEMTCEYCGLARPVPDVDRRRKAIERAAEREERRRCKAEEKARRRAERSEQDRRRRRRSAARWLLVLPLKLLPLGLVAFVLYQVGVYDLLFGDAGEEMLRQEVSRLEADGFAQVGAIRLERAVLPPARITVGMERGYCYAVAVGSGKSISQVRLRVGKAAVRTPNLPGASLVHCPPRAGVRQVEVSLAGMGRFSWALLRRAAPRATASERPPRRHGRRRVRRPPRRRKRPERARQRKAIPTDPVPDPFESEVPLEGR